MSPSSVTDASTPTAPQPAASAGETGLAGAVACLSLASFASGASMRLNDAMLPRLSAEFDVALGTAAQVTGVFAVAYGIAQLGFGPLGERFGKYRFIAWACIAGAVTSTLCAAAPGFAALVW